MMKKSCRSFFSKFLLPENQTNRVKLLNSNYFNLLDKFSQKISQNIDPILFQKN